jgi:integrase
MPDKMKWQSELKLFKSGAYEYIYVYFKHKNNIIRVNTGNKYVKSYCNKDLLYNNNMTDYVKLNQRTHRLMEKVDQYIFAKYQGSYPTFSQKECLKFIENLHFDTATKKMIPIDRVKVNASIPTKKSVIEYYNEFIEYKRIELKDSPSLKDYKSLLNAIMDYQTTTKKKITFDTINNKDFWNRFRTYLAAKHKVGKSKGELNNNTVHKRFSSLKTFMRWIEEEKEIFIFKHTLYHYKIQKFSTDFVTLDREEIRQLENLKIDNPNWQRIIDVFICNCFMSLRFGDMQTLAKGKFLKDRDGDYYYTKKNEKTKRTIEIPITRTALEILKRYNFDLPTYSNQYFNRELYKILEHYKLFDEKVQKQELRDGEPSVKYYKKRELITTHTARRTYITNAITNNVSLNAIQSSTGHSQLSTLSKYVKANRNKQQLNKID